MNAILSFFEQIKLHSELKKETDLYLMEPLYNTTYCWNKSEDISDMDKSTTIYFDQLKENEFLATIYDCKGNSYWKLYIVENKKISKVFIETRMMNPVNKKK